MKIDVLTLFPELFDKFRDWSIIGRTMEKGIFSLNTVNIREFSKNKHKKVDDYPFGGGPGMIMGAEPIYNAISDTKNEDSMVIYLSPQGKPYTQELAKKLSKKKHLILLCGHYEGVDNRIVDNFIDLEVSIGDYVLTGGELPAMVLIESIIRLLPGALSQKESYMEESHYNGLLEHPQYTRPRTFNNLPVPEVLLSGHHKNISDWKKYQSLRTTYIKRPDLLSNLNLSDLEIKLLKDIKEELENED